MTKQISKQKLNIPTAADEAVVISRNKFEAIRKILAGVHDSLGRINELLASDLTAQTPLADLVVTVGAMNDELNSIDGGKVIEGVFDGFKMISNEGKTYDVPANYASKSKLVEGDILKLTVKKNGTFIYKQISPVERRRVVGTLSIEESSGQYYVMVEGKAYKVLPASVTYYKGNIGDEAIVLVPKDGGSGWGAIENIIKK